MRHLKFSASVPSEYESYQALISTEGVKIERLQANDTETVGCILHVWYTLDKETVDEEKYRLTTCIEKARLVNREEYDTFKNANQRGIYLLSKYGIGGREGSDVQELLKPELAMVLNGGVS